MWFRLSVVHGATFIGALGFGTLGAAASSLSDIQRNSEPAATTARSVQEPTDAELAADDDLDPQPSLATADREETELPLTLVATMEGEAPGTSFVTITHANGVTGVYAEGDEVMPGVEVHAIGPGVVVLRTDDGLEVLQLGTGEAEEQ